MFVSSYQIHNVLYVYSKQLSQGRSAQREKPETKRPLGDQINLSAEGKRRATIERVAEDILNKIFYESTSDKIKATPNSVPRQEASKNIEPDSSRETEFVFNSIDALNRKTKTALSVEDTNFLIGGPEQAAKDAAEEDSDR